MDGMQYKLTILDAVALAYDANWNQLSEKTPEKLLEAAHAAIAGEVEDWSVRQGLIKDLGDDGVLELEEHRSVNLIVGIKRITDKGRRFLASNKEPGVG